MFVIYFILGFQLLIIILNRIINDKPKVLDYLAVIIGFIQIILFGILYPLPELASSPAKVTATNITNEELDIYYLTIHDSIIINQNNIGVHHDKKLAPQLSSEYFFETETADFYWVIAINTKGDIKYSNSCNINRMSILNYSFRIEPTNKLNASNQKLAKDRITRYKWFHSRLIALMILMLILNILIIRDIRRN